jgi:hypothetical protein
MLALSIATAGPLEHEYENIIRRTLEAVILVGLHPRCSVMVAVQVSNSIPNKLQLTQI